jgi:hypothetical protein
MAIASNASSVNLNVLDHLEDSLKLATIDENWKHRVGKQSDLRIKFNAPDLTVRQEGYFQIINLEGQEITIGSNATDEQIGAEIARIRKTEPMTKPGSFAAGIRAMMDEARAGVAKAREDGLAKVGDAVKKLDEAKVATVSVAGQMAKTIEDEAAEVMSELGQISNDLGGEAQ